MRVAIAAVGVVAVAVIAFAVGARHGGDHATQRRKTKSTTTRPTKLVGEARTLVELLDRGRAVPVHVKYAVRSAQADAQGSNVEIELWRKPPRVRQDTVVTSPGQSARGATF